MESSFPTRPACSMLKNKCAVGTRRQSKRFSKNSSTVHSTYVCLTQVELLIFLHQMRTRLRVSDSSLCTRLRAFDSSLTVNQAFFSISSNLSIVRFRDMEDPDERGPRIV